jgi:hypothetical protein
VGEQHGKRAWRDGNQIRPGLRVQARNGIFNSVLR